MQQASELRRRSFRLDRRLGVSARSLGIACATILVLVRTAPAVPADTCQGQTTVGLDTAYVNDIAPLELGEAVGQTFHAPTTEIVAITAWRSVYWTDNGSVWRIFVMGLDSLGVPDVNQIIQNGPTLKIQYGDGSHPTAFRFVFDPPIQLPKSGEYEFAIQGDQCVGYFDLAGCGGDGSAYPDGVLWDHGRMTVCAGYPRPGPQAYPLSDLAFTVEFCPSGTPVVPTTWGRIKSQYR
jgi:hypothetical protein